MLVRKHRISRPCLASFLITMALAMRRVLHSVAAGSGSAAWLRASRGFATQAPWVKTLNADLEHTDPDLFDILEHEKRRQRDSVCLIPSEVSNLITA